MDYGIHDLWDDTNRAVDAASRFLDHNEDLVLRAIPQFVGGLFLFLLWALAIVNILINRRRQRQPWLDALAIALALGLPGLAAWLWIQSASFADVYRFPPLTFDIVRVEFAVACLIGIRYAVVSLTAGVRDLVALYRAPASPDPDRMTDDGGSTR